MNIFKLSMLIAYAFTINATASESLTPVEKFTMLKNSSHLSSLEKKRAQKLQEREDREQLRQYMELKR